VSDSRLNRPLTCSREAQSLWPKLALWILEDCALVFSCVLHARMSQEGKKECIAAVLGPRRHSSEAVVDSNSLRLC
jgi:hypothetical protein